MTSIADRYNGLLEKEGKLSQYKVRLTHFFEESLLASSLGAIDPDKEAFKKRVVGTAEHLYKEYAGFHEAYEALRDEGVEIERKAKTEEEKLLARMIVDGLTHEVKRTGHEMRIAKSIEDKLLGIKDIADQTAVLTTPPKN